MNAHKVIPVNLAVAYKLKRNAHTIIYIYKDKSIGPEVRAPYVYLSNFLKATKSVIL